MLGKYTNNIPQSNHNSPKSLFELMEKAHSSLAIELFCISLHIKKI